MRDKILKTELLIFFVFTLTGLVYFHFGHSLPDNMFAISSEVEKTGVITYFFTGILAFLGLISGPWMLGPFFIFIFLYSFLLSKRTFVFDLFMAPFLGLFFLSISQLYFTEYVGEGLNYLLSEYVDSTVLFIMMLSSFIILYILYFRESVAGQLKDFFRFTKNNMIQSTRLFSPSFWKNNWRKPTFELTTFKNKMLAIKVAFLQFFRRKKKVRDEIVSISQAEDFLPNALPPKKDSLSEETKQLAGLQAPEHQEELPLSIRPTKVVGVINPKYKFNLNELIISISTQKSTRKIVSAPETKYFDDIVFRLEEKLGEFKVDAQVINIIKGPVVDTFELELGPGVKVSRVTSITEDLSLALCGVPIRMVYPMMGKTTVGVEIPREGREIIYLDQVLSSPKLRKNNFKLPLAMGKNSFGETTFVDLASMPHMLVAGVTGSGKSVFINTILVSLLIKLSPAQLKLILIDPKQLELALYADIPHLILPVVTDAKAAAYSLLWATQEMERRYSILKEFAVRNIDGFNEKLGTATADDIARIEKYYNAQTDEGLILPYLVIIVDEFADLILTKNGKEIEANVCRLAAKARAAGIHLVVATQRPSVDVITGLIKSNFPTRVSFRVTSSIDSRTILNTIGAEKLLGKGDMLYKHGIEMTRLHSSYVDESEIEGLMEKLKSIPQNFNQEALDFIENGPDGLAYETGNDRGFGSSSFAPTDDLYDQGVRVVTEHGVASASMLQRRLRIGYNRAANLIEEMEAKGIVGPQEGSRPRKVLASPGDLSV